MLPKKPTVGEIMEEMWSAVHPDGGSLSDQPDAVRAGYMTPASAVLGLFERVAEEQQDAIEVLLHKAVEELAWKLRNPRLFASGSAAVLEDYVELFGDAFLTDDIRGIIGESE